MFNNCSLLLKSVFLGFALIATVKSFSQQDYLVKNFNQKSTQQNYVVTNEHRGVFVVTPAVVQKSAKLIIDAPFKGWATFELKDYSGEVVLEQQMAVDKGINTIPVFFISKIEKGEYTSLLKIEDKIFFSKLVKE